MRFLLDELEIGVIVDLLYYSKIKVVLLKMKALQAFDD